MSPAITGSQPRRWLTGAAWNWGAVYAELVEEIRDGTYRSSAMLAGLDAGWVKLSPLGVVVPAEVSQLALDTVEGLRNDTIQPFTGPIMDQAHNGQDGTVRIAEGESPTDAELQTMDYLVEGIIGRTR